ncbi:hypothetical protein LJC56_01900 [Christensenellaceae bacterium OttesenSCG-928-K19]|nr:hypothetical protein [Christensenellaceae bacterium OttesenSCG-928-K19]
MKATFISKKLHFLILANTFQIGVDYIVSLCSSVIGGNLLGGAALSAISLASPFLIFIIFTSDICGLGASSQISYEIGKHDSDKANRYFSQGLIFSVCMGGVLTTLYLLINTLNPNLFGVSAETNTYFREYLQYIYILPLLQAPGSYLYMIVINEGGEKTCMAASIIRAASMVVLSTILCTGMGAGGIGLATVLSFLVSRAPLVIFMLSKRFSLRFRWHFDTKTLGRILTVGASGAGFNLFLCLMRLVLNVFLLSRFGEPALVVFAVMMNVLELMIALFSSTGFSLSMPVSMYRGEHMQTSIRKTMHVALRVAAIEGVLLAIVLFAFSGQVAGVFGVVDATLAAQAATGVRIFAAGCLPAAILLLMICYYSYIEKIRLAFGFTMLYLFLLPISLGAGLGLAFGLEGVMWGISISSAVALGLLLLIVKTKWKKSTFPLLLNPHALASELSYDVEKSQDGVMTLVDMVEHDLTEHGLGRAAINKIMLMIEETQMLALESGKLKNEVIECGIVLGDTISVILRDSGSNSDPADEETGHADTKHMLPMMIIGAHKDRMYTLAGGKSRVVYRFPYAE